MAAVKQLLLRGSGPPGLLAAAARGATPPSLGAASARGGAGAAAAVGASSASAALVAAAIAAKFGRSSDGCGRQGGELRCSEDGSGATASSPPWRLAVRSLPPSLSDIVGGASAGGAIEGGLLCNSADELVRTPAFPTGAKIVWFVRHGESLGNVAKAKARKADAAEGGRRHEDTYVKDLRYADCAMTEKGEVQALRTKNCVSLWGLKPLLIVCSPLTRCLQTAAIVFEEELLAGTVRLVVRPELREFFPRLPEDSGRPLHELRSCPRLGSLACWPQVEKALSDEATAEWREQWDTQWARAGDGVWQAHCNSGERLQDFSSWLANQPEAAVAVVTHWGFINNHLNREPWAGELERQEVPKSWGRHAWPPGGLARTFRVENCGWIAVLAEPYHAL